VSGSSATPEPKRFAVIRISTHAHEALKDLEQAVIRLGSGRTDEEVHRDYPAVCLARETIYQYISELEKHTKLIEQEVTVRFF
jgi:hypothetical protein